MAETRKLFTVARANKALPLVTRIVDDVVGKFASLKELERERTKAKHEHRETIERQMFDLEGEIERHVAELEAIGVELKDPAKGLLDFLAHDGKSPIYLCWMKGEPEVAWWHPLETGFAGRRPVGDLPKAVRGET
jgi:hypothetical protein